MINRLRRHFIFVNMLLVGIVILMIVSVVCVNSYSTALGDLEHGLNRIVDNSGRNEERFDPNNGEKNNNTDSTEGSTDSTEPVTSQPQVIGKPDMRGEHPLMLSSYIYVEVDSDGNIVKSTENGVTIDSDDLSECVKTVLESSALSGQLSDYGLVYAKNGKLENTRIAFADNSSVYSTLGNTMLVGGVLLAASLVVIFLISLGLSSLAVKPVKKAWEQQKQFVADASHELKTPLTVILANNNIIMSHKDSTVADERQWLESTEEEAQHMKKLIDQMLFLAKSDAGTSNIELCDVDFSEIAEATTLNFEPVAFEKQIMIDSEIDSQIVLRGNSLWLNQLSHILIDNAVKYAAPDTTVTIRLKRRENAVEFSVNNLGSVISEEELEHIFDRFYRAEKSRTTKGYGLGLSIAKRITEKMNGRLTAASNETDGTTFTAMFKTV